MNNSRPLLYRSQFLLRILGALMIAGYFHSPFSAAENILAQGRVNLLIGAYIFAILLLMAAARSGRLPATQQRAQIFCDVALTMTLPAITSGTRLPAVFFLSLAFIDYGLRFGIRRYAEASVAALLVLVMRALWQTDFQWEQFALKDSWMLLLVVLVCAAGMVLLYEHESQALRPTSKGFSQRVAVELAGIGRFEMRLPQREVHWDEQMHRLLGLPPGPTEGPLGVLLNLVVPADREYVQRELSRAIEQNQPIDIAARVIWPDGSTHMLASRASIQRDQLGVPHMIGLSWDITDTMRAREQARHLEHWRTAATQAGGIVVWSYDVAQHRWETDGDIATLFHLDPQALQKLRDSPASIIPVGDEEQMRDALVRALESGLYSAEFRVRGSDGLERWMHAQGVAERSSSGEIIRLVGATWDVDSDVTLRIEAESARKQLEAAYRELETFTQVAAHDFKEPLRGIRNYAKFLEEDYGERIDEAGRDMLKRLSVLGQRLDRLIEGLLEISRVNWMALQRKPTDLDALVEEILATLDFSLQENHVEVRRPRPLPTLDCDATQVSQIYRNLITNAIKYNDKAQRWIELGWEGTLDVPTFYVRDNGIGINPQHHHDIFTRFRRLHAADRFGEGSGLGLAIVRRIVERHGGRIWLESEPGEGTTFRFSLTPDFLLPLSGVELGRPGR